MMMNNMNQEKSSKLLKNPNVIKRPREKDEEILNYFLYQFKCKQCQFKKGICPDKATCEGWHHEGERRRNPLNGSCLLYSEEPCPRLKMIGKWLKPSNCENGDRCPYSHTMLEQMYHPNIYKTSLCTNFSSTNGDQCQWGYYCTHAHGQHDIRNPNKKNVQEINLEEVIPINTTINDTNDTLNSSNKQTSMSPPRSQNTPSYQNGVISNTDINTPNSKSSPLPPTGPPITQPLKPPHLLLPTTVSSTSPNSSSQIPTHSKTPNYTTNSTSYPSSSSHTFPYRLYNEQKNQHQQQQYKQFPHYSWDITSNNSLNSQRTPPPPTIGSKSCDVFCSNVSPKHSPVSFGYNPQKFVPNTSTILNSSSIKPQTPNQIVNNGFINHVSQSNNSSKYITPQPLQQQQISQPQSQQQLTILQRPNEISQTNIGSNINQLNEIKDIKDIKDADDVSYYLFGDDPLSNSTNVTIYDKQNEEIFELRQQLNELKEQLKLEKEKNQLLLQTQYDDLNCKNEIERMEQLKWLERYIICLNCNSHQKPSRNNVLVPCGHLVCEECIPQQGQFCPICKTIINQNVQKLNL